MSPMREAWITGVATAIGAFIPVFPFLVWSGWTAVILSFAVSMLSLLYLPVYFLLLTPDFGDASTGEIVFLAFYQGILASIVSLLLFSVAVQNLCPQRATLGNATVPIFATMLAVPILGELPSPVQWLGIALVVGSVILAARMQEAPPVKGK